MNASAKRNQRLINEALDLLSVVESRRAAPDARDIAAAPWCVCESPIEVLLYAALVRAPWEDAPQQMKPTRYRSQPLEDFSPSSVWLDFDFHQRLSAISPFVSIVPQAAFGPFRVDFLVRGVGRQRSKFECIVECDGHEWHASEDQRASDLRREGAIRDLTGKHHAFIRFTGSSIYRDADKCAAEIVRRVRGFVPTVVELEADE